MVNQVRKADRIAEVDTASVADVFVDLEVLLVERVVDIEIERLGDGGRRAPLIVETDIPERKRRHR